MISISYKVKRRQNVQLQCRQCMDESLIKRRTIMKKIKKILAGCLLSSAILSNGVVSVGAQDNTLITFLIGKEEIANQLNETVQAYNASQDLYTVEIMPLAGQNANERMMSLYASNNAPVLMNTGAYNDLAQWENEMLDLSELPMVAHISEEYLEPGTVNGKLIGLPTTIEAFGFLYNQDILNQATGEEFDFNKINSREKLNELFQSITTIEGTHAIEISSMDWSLGAHFTNLFFATQSEDTEVRAQFMEDLKAGEITLLENDAFVSWVDTLDLMMSYNRSASSPLSANYDNATIGLATGEIGTWFMGNWALPQVQEVNPEVNIGIMPVPIFAEEGVFGNNEISIGVPNTWAIDGSQSTEEEQAGAKDFLTWLYTDEEGQDYYYNVMGYIPITDNASVEIEDSLSEQIMIYIQEGRGLEWMNAKYPPTAFPTMGASIQKYLSGNIDREGLAAELEQYWSTVE